MKQRLACILFCCSIFGAGSAHAHSALGIDSARHSPTRAIVYSAILPGLGQAYNRDYWKIPIIYAGFGGLGYGLYYYQGKYTTFRDAYNANRDNTTGTINIGGIEYSLSNVRAGRDFYRRYRDMCIIGTSAWYLLNILEAYVYANLFDFDVSDNLSLHISPALMSTAQARIQPGLNLSFSF
ncbi:MAG: DUF5683 domain-containing protein [Bacteroidales bacterium]|jgi:hypothetical protein|nr:DUF5683 domain-containing protein [Bacteroidales bacterium]